MFDLPIFPLNTVLLPNMPLHLHIFEERYKQMMQFCRLTSLPFGVVLIKNGAEANDPLAEPYEFGCTAHVSQLEPLSEGRYNLLALGQDRFRIISLKRDQPYLVGVVEKQPLLMPDAQAAAGLVAHLRTWLERYVRLLGEGDEVDEILQRIPMEPGVFAYTAAMILQVPPAHKQIFLEIGDSLNLLEELISRYRRETALVRQLVSTQPARAIGRFTVN